MNTDAQKAVFKKMQYILKEISVGPLSEAECEYMIARLKDCKHESLYGIAVRKHFEKEQTDHSEFLQSVASQCVDNFILLSAIVDLDVVILLLRYYDQHCQWCKNSDHKHVNLDNTGDAPRCLTCGKKVML